MNLNYTRICKLYKEHRASRMGVNKKERSNTGSYLGSESQNECSGSAGDWVFVGE